MIGLVATLDRVPRPLARTPEPVVEPGRRLTELDGIRGIAILMVLFVHAGSYEAPKYSLPYFLMLPRQLMWSGVDLFFVLSGFLIAGILLDHRESPRYYSVFYARRCLRILPLYYVLFTSLLIGLWLLPQSDLFAGAMPLWAYPLFLQNTVSPWPTSPIWMLPMWSLAVEEQFYLLFPFLARACRRRTLLLFCLSCIVLAPVVRAALFAQGDEFHKVSLPARVDTIAFGVLAAIIVRNAAATRWLSTHSRLLYAVMFVAGITAVSQLKWPALIVACFSYTALALTYFCFLLAVLLAPVDGVTRLLQRRWLIWLGALSYCLYVVHQPVLFSLFRAFGYVEPAITSLETLLLTLTGIAIALGIAQLSWTWLERPFIQRAHRLYRY